MLPFKKLVHFTNQTILMDLCAMTYAAAVAVIKAAAAATVVS